MDNKFIDCLMNPIMGKIYMNLSGGKEMTAKQLAQLHPDIPQTTLYRYIKRMLTEGVIKTVKETPVRGTIERTYALAIDFKAGIASIVDDNSGEAYMALFMQYISGLTKLFGDYCKKSDIDIKGDISFFNAVPIYISDEELEEAIRQMDEIAAKIMENKPSKERKLRTLGTILTPPQ
ncbi:hypothetical protein M2454_001418 [Aequitasia blattaphilus]|uniref:Uncharacterized protein n=1 Tax=Aequitasia blattaphilus TaxID=2949332 RepID=A0ABT1EBX9_9FIRM|nr:hypothetical protein [Aequitasia blattaphilus]MCP1103330.1 hypothetical protein [Aequitasia blattaphilus]MCR8615970.1 hypothetical protein [Aequitasia blattaphilus]